MRRLLPLCLFACAAPDGTGFFQKMDVRVVDDEVGAALEMLPLIEDAQDTLRVALPRATYQPLTDAIIEAHARRVDVTVITDIDQQDDPGIQDLLAAGVPTSLNDDGISYFEFAFNNDVRWTSDQVVMSHAFVIADGVRLANATSVGGQDPSPQIVIQTTGEVLAEDFGAEHNQIFGGSDATALTAFSAAAKSRTDVRHVYTNDTDTPIVSYFGPQERVTKRVIDGIYSARRSVRIMSNDIANAGINQALLEKSRWGFPCEAIVGPAFDGQRVARPFQRDLVDVNRLRSDSDMPTVVLIDIEGGPDTMPRAYVVSHDLYSAERFYFGTEVITDQLIDGNLMILEDNDYVLGEDADSPLQGIVDLYLDIQAQAGPF